MTVQYSSTRDVNNRVSASLAILKGISEDGGLYVPDHIPALPMALSDIATMTYQEVAYQVMQAFFSDFSSEELWACIHGAYNNKNFDCDTMTHLKAAGDAYYLELFHGRTIAFKDMALSILPYLLTVSAKKQGVNKEIVILTATSGDTGKAAMEGFADVPGTRIIVFYPDGAVSHIQELQMRTQKGNNTHVIAIKGNFDDAQSEVKRLFNDRELAQQIERQGYQFSSANSINIGRLIPQVAYYVFAYGQLVKSGALQVGEAMNVVVPTGNFGNILAAYYAYQMGIPVKHFICASNKNNVLSDFFAQGEYNRQRPFYVTNSPSMDILISSNLERLVYDMTGKDTTLTAELMQQLADNGKYQVTSDMMAHVANFYGGTVSEVEVEKMIGQVFASDHYVIDPHTAVGAHVYQQYRQQTGDTTPTIIAATASPYKFPRSVLSGLGENVAEVDDLVAVQQLQTYVGGELPVAVQEVLEATIRHSQVSQISEMKASVLAILDVE